MGGDGGSIAQRTELVRTRKKQEQLARDVKDAAKWRYCALSQQPLQQPIVACPFGRLFNKEALIRAMIDKTILQIENAKHITSLKDVKELNFTNNPDMDRMRSDKGDAYKDPNVSMFICPVVGLGMNGKYRFCVIWNCGCVLSERALKEIKSEVCQKCGEKFDDKDIIVLYGSQEEVNVYKERFETMKEAQKAKKASRKANKEVEQVDGQKVGNKRKITEMKNEKDLAIASGSKSKVSKPGQSDVQKDETKSTVFKSLFTTCESAKNQPKAHWVTYNPLYY